MIVFPLVGATFTLKVIKSEMERMIDFPVSLNNLDALALLTKE
jgi:hypothetical protein